VDNVGSNPCGSSNGQESLNSTGKPTPVPVAKTGFTQLEACLTSVLAILDEWTEAKKRVVPEQLVNRVGTELTKIKNLAQRYVLDNVRLGAQVEILVAWGTPKEGTVSRSGPEASQLASMERPRSHRLLLSHLQRGRRQRVAGVQPKLER